MVSATNTIDGGGGGAAMALPAMMGPLTATSASAAAEEDPNKKIRKPYTIAKSRESWTDQEHDKFLEALQFFDRDWKKIEAFVASKTVIQIRSHAQKYFLKVEKNGTSEHIPPPRPKRKAAHPYPQKASKNASLLSQPVTAYQASSCLLEPGYVPRTDSSSVLRNSSTSGTMSSWAHSSIPPRSALMTKENIGPAGTMVSNNGCSTESPPSTWLACETIDRVNHLPSLRIMPDFDQVCSFIGTVFDPNTSGHLEKLKEMDPIDVETVLLLMRNLSVNLTSPDFEDHRKLLASYEISSEEINFGNATDTIEADETVNGSFMVGSKEKALARRSKG